MYWREGKCWRGRVGGGRVGGGDVMEGTCWRGSVGGYVLAGKCWKEWRNGLEGDEWRDLCNKLEWDTETKDA
jgi:hypothetical protein